MEVQTIKYSSHLVFFHQSTKNISIHVYFWHSQPVVYQFQEFPLKIHLQCKSGIHFNSLVELHNYVPPDPQQCSVVSVQDRVAADCGSGERGDDSEDSEMEELTRCLLNIDRNVSFCEHTFSSSLPQISVSSNDRKFCAVLDTGAEISLISESALEVFRTSTECTVENEYVCDIVGCSGGRTAIDQTAIVQFKLGNTLIDKHKFGVVKDQCLPTASCSDWIFSQGLM